MIINNLFFEHNSLSVKLSADVTFRGDKSEKIYLVTDIKNKDFIVNDYSPFLAAVLLPCMKTREDIYIDGPVSRKLLQNTKKIMFLVEKWNVGLKRVKIKAKSITDDRALKPKRTGVFFSAGVDSFYTYLKNKRTVTDLVFVHGFDIPLPNTDLFRKTKRIISKIADDEKRNAVFVKTNIAEVVEKKLVWDFAHGGALAAVALFLRGMMKKMYIAGAVRKDKLFPYGTHPQLDKNWATEKMHITHDGTEYCRLEKIMHRVGKSPLALKYLHVCTQNIKGKYNCSKCFKCLTTMIELVCSRTLAKSKTFEHNINLQDVKNMYYDYSLLYNILGEANLEELIKQKRETDLQNAIAESLRNSKKPRIMKKLFNLAASFDQKYNKRRLYRYVFAMNKNQDRNFVFKFLLQKGVFK
jgi:hypothetical protein